MQFIETSAERYMVLIYGSHEAWDAISPQRGAEIGAVHVALQEELVASGELVCSRELVIAGARVVRTDRGSRRLVDAAFSEGKEILAGFYVVDVSGLDRATEIAARFAEADFAPVEVRRLSDASSWEPDAG